MPKQSFFCVGEQIQKYPEVVKRMQAEGHLVANHTFTHQPKNILHAKALANEIRHTDEALAHLDIVTPYSDLHTESPHHPLVEQFGQQLKKL